MKVQTSCFDNGQAVRGSHQRVYHTRFVMFIWLVLCFFDASLSAATEPDEQLYDIDVPQLNAADALNRLAEQTGAIMLFPFDLASARNANAVLGRYTLTDALALLLQNSGLSSGLSDKQVVQIFVTEVDEHHEEDGDMEKPKLSKRKTIVTVLTSIFAASASSGQEIAAESGALVIEEIVVTATRRETSLQETSVAVTAYTSENMARIGIEGFEDFARQTPGTLILGDKGFQFFAIRGIQNSGATAGNGQSKPVAVYIDDVPVNTFAVLTPDIRLYDVERVEVLRGPQGAAFGAGSMAGTVRVLTNKADPSGFDSSFRVDAGTTSGGGTRQRYSGMVNFPLVDDEMALRVVGYVRDEEGWIDNIGAWGYPGNKNENTNEDWGIRTSLRWLPSEDVTATFSVAHEDATLIGRHNYDPTVSPPGTFQQAYFYLQDNNSVSTNVNATVEFDFDWATLVSSTTYAEATYDWGVDLDALLRTVLPFGYGEHLEQGAFVQEIRLISNDEGPLEWLAGFFYLDRETDFLGNLWTTQEFVDQAGIDNSAMVSPTAAGSGWPTNATSIGTNIKVNHHTEAAFYGELTYHFSDTFNLVAGLRYSVSTYGELLTDQGSDNNIIQMAENGESGPITIIQDSTLEGTATGREFSPNIALNWTPSDDRLYYVSVAKGFRRPHPNVSCQRVSPVDPTDPTIIPTQAVGDITWNYELGAKTHWMDGRLQANVAAYFIDWQDVQVQAARPSDGCPFTASAGEAESSGVEAEFLLSPSVNLQLGLNVTVGDSEIVSITEEDSLASGATLGTQLVGPDFKLSGFAQYAWSLNNGNTIYARVDAQHVGESTNALPNLAGQPTATPNPRWSLTDPYENVNVQVGWQTEKYSVALYGENILDEDAIIYDNAGDFTNGRFGTLRPTTVGVRFDWNY